MSTNQMPSNRTRSNNGASSHLQAMLTVLLKELRELSRDRRTLMLALMMPLLFPVLIIGMGTLAENRAKGQMEKDLKIAIVGAEHAPNLVAWLAGQGIARKTLAKAPDAAIRDQDEDVYLKIEDDFGKHWREGTPALVEIVHDSTRQDAGIPVKRVGTVAWALAGLFGSVTNVDIVEALQGLGHTVEKAAEEFNADDRPAAMLSSRTPSPASPEARWSAASRSSARRSSGVRSATMTPDAPAAASRRAASRPSPPPMNWFA